MTNKKSKTLTLLALCVVLTVTVLLSVVTLGQNDTVKAATATQSATFLQDKTNPTVSSVSDYNLTKVGDCAYDSDKGAYYFDKSSAVYATKRSDGYDFMDDFVGTDFTITTEFMLPKTLASGQEANGRGVIFSLWGLWNGNSYGVQGSEEANWMASSLVYEQYASGADTVLVRFAFLRDTINGGTENGWWGDCQRTIQTDMFHRLVFSVSKDFHIVACLDGEKVWEMDCSKKQMFKSNHMQFTLGGAYGDGGLSEHSGSSYMKTFSITNSIVSINEMIELSMLTQLSQPPTSENMPSSVNEEGGPLASYPFNDSNNAGKSNRGGMFDLEAVGGTPSVSNGEITTNGAVLTAKRDMWGYDFIDYLQEYTVTFSFYLPTGAVDNLFLLTLYGIGDWVRGYEPNNFDSGAIMVRAYDAQATQATISLGFNKADEVSPANPLWSAKTCDVAVGAWHNLAFSYSGTDSRVVSYVDGIEIGSIDIDAKYYKNTKIGFGIGGAKEIYPNGSARLVSNISTKYKNLKVYDYCFTPDELNSYSADGAFSANKITEPAKVTELTVPLTHGYEDTVQPSAYVALMELVNTNKKARVSLSDGSDNVRADVMWYTAKKNEDGSVSVYGFIIGAHNPDGIGVIANVDIASYKITFKGSNFTAKVNDKTVTSTQVQFGDDLSFTITPKNGYKLETVKVGKAELKPQDGVYTISNVDSTITVLVTVKSTTVTDKEETTKKDDDLTTDNTVTTNDTTSGGCAASVDDFNLIALLLSLSACAVVLDRKLKNYNK